MLKNIIASSSQHSGKENCEQELHFYFWCVNLLDMILLDCCLFLADSLTPPADVPAHHGLHLRALLLFGYGVLLIIGGVMGYLKAKSMPSLIAGGGSGVLALLLGFLAPWYYTPFLALLLSLALAVVMGNRYLKTKQAMPALLVVGLSLLVAAAQVYSLILHH